MRFFNTIMHFITIGLILWLYFFKTPYNGSLEVKEKVVTDTIVIVDTLTVELKEVVIKEPMVVQSVKEIVYSVDTLTNKIVDTVYVDVFQNSYSDTISVDGARLSYRHLVTGSLDASSYSVEYPYREVYVKDSVFVTNFIKPKMSFFLNSSISFPDLRQSIGCSLLWGRYNLGYSFGRVPEVNGSFQNSHRVTIGYKIFER